jgi:hypothetical protein
MLNRRIDIEDVVSAHLLAIDKAAPGLFSGELLCSRAHADQATRPIGGIIDSSMKIPWCRSRG